MKRTFWISALLVLNACSSPTDSSLPAFFQGWTDPGYLQAATWKLTEAIPVEGATDFVDVTVRLQFTPDRVSGYAGPNTFGGEYWATSRGSLRMGEILMTLIGGPEAEEAADYLRKIAGVRAFRVNSDELLLDLAEHGIFRFRPETPVLIYL